MRVRECTAELAARSPTPPIPAPVLTARRSSSALRLLRAVVASEDPRRLSTGRPPLVPPIPPSTISLERGVCEYCPPAPPVVVVPVLLPAVPARWSCSAEVKAAADDEDGLGSAGATHAHCVSSVSVSPISWLWSSSVLPTRSIDQGRSKGY